MRDSERGADHFLTVLRMDFGEKRYERKRKKLKKEELH